MRTAVLVVACLGSAVQQVPPPPQPSVQAPRDMVRRPVEPVGTGVIRGRVLAADTGTPIRRGQVNLSPLAPASSSAAANNTAATQTIALPNGQIVTTPGASALRPKTATTDLQGAFEFRDLPAGRYRVTASPGQYSAGYLPLAFGATKPNNPGVPLDPGTPIDLGDGQTYDKAIIALPRGGAITGRVTDENGDPLARVQVYTVTYLPGSSRPIRTGSGSQTDDLGQFRLFGLAPGDYLVAAEARPNTFVNPNAPPENEEDRTGFLTTYYPGTADEGGAQRVRARAAAETSGIEIRLVSGRLFHITGMVTDSQGHASRTNGTLFKRTNGGVNTTYGFGTDEQGRFQMRNIAPGNYRLVVRQQPLPGLPNADGSPRDQGEFASMPLTVESDLDDILVVTSAGATITGVVAFETGAPQRTSGQPQLRVSALMADSDNMIGTPLPQPSLVGPDLTFTLKGLAGELLLRASAPPNFLKAVLLGDGEEITDAPHEFKNGERVTILLTNQTSTVQGTVTDAVGKPSGDAALVLFSDDKATWRANSIRTRRGISDANGQFKITGVLPGRYFLLAVPRTAGLALGNDPALFETLSKDATSVVVGQDEQRQVDLTISKIGGQ